METAHYRNLKGPKGLPLLGSVLDYFKEPLGLFENAKNQFGDLVPVKMGPFTAYLVSHPDAVEDFFMKQAKNLIKSHAVRTGIGVLGNGLLTSEGDFWRRQRRLSQPAFHQSKIHSYAADMVALTDHAIREMKEKAKRGEKIEVHSTMMRLTLAIASKTLFNRDITGPESELVAAGLTDVLDWWNTHFMIPTPLQPIPTPSRLRFNRGVKALNGLVYSIIEERRRSGADPGDFLSMLMNARDEDGSQMTDEQIRDEVITLLLAGHETTANLLTWAFYLLSQHSEVRSSVEKEIDAILGVGAQARTPTPADMPKFAKLEQVVNETLRLYPPAWATGREATQDLTLGGMKFPKGTNFFVSIWVIHHDARWFEKPYEFKPERWTPEFKAQLHKYAFVPFGGGPRSCIGNQFALAEAFLLMSRIISQLHLVAEPGLKLTPMPQITLRPAEKVWMTASPR